MKTYPKVTLGLLMIVIVIVLGVGVLVIIDFYSVEARAPMNLLSNYVDAGIDEENGYPPPVSDPCPDLYPPPYPTLYPAPNLCKYLPLMYNNFEDILLGD